MQNQVDLHDGLKASVNEDRVHSLIDYLQRPVRIDSGVWSSTSAQFTLLNDYSVPTIAFQQPMLAAKAQGFLGFRAKAIIRVQINAQRFQQGRLMLAYFPQAQTNLNRANVAAQSLTLTSQLPRVELDCSSTTACELEMPYVSTTTHFNFQDYTGPHGVFYLYVYSPLVSGAATSVNYTVWLRFEDVELSFPTVTFTPEMNSIVFKPEAGKFKGRKGTSSQREMASSGHPGFSQTVEAKPYMGKVEEWFNNATTLFDYAKMVPPLSHFAAPASWVCATGTKVAHHFGWSNPNNNEVSQNTVIRSFQNSQNVDNANTSHKIGMFSDNTVEILPGFAGTDNDEMDINYIASIPAYIETFQWSTSDAEDAGIFSNEHNAFNYRATRLVNDGTRNVTVSDFIPAFYIANMFRYWRGSIRLTFKVVKTEFHSGRLLFYYYPIGPKNDPGTGKPTDDDLQYVYKEVFDLKVSNEFTVTLPFVKTTPYAKWTESIGYYGLMVLNPLIAPSTVSSTVNILFEASAGPDFEVAVPDGMDFVPVYQQSTNTFPTPELTTVSSPEVSFEKIDFKPEVGDLDEEITAQDSSPQVSNETVPIASTDINSGGLSAARFCIGEKLSSLRQLVKRSAMWFEWDQTTIPTDVVRLIICPSDITCPRFTTGTQINNSLSYTLQSSTSAYTLPDYYNIIAPLYGYRRGGMRIKLYHSTPAPLQGAGNAIAKQSIATTWRAMVATRPAGSSTALFLNSGQSFNYGKYENLVVPSLDLVPVAGGMQVEIPQYLQQQSSMVLNYTSASSMNAGTLQLYNDQNCIVAMTNEPLQHLVCLRSMADDGNLGFFIGVLPLVSQNDAQTYGTGYGDTSF
jgi:hypothetical protein